MLFGFNSSYTQVGTQMKADQRVTTESTSQFAELFLKYLSSLGGKSISVKGVDKTSLNQ